MKKLLVVLTMIVGLKVTYSQEVNFGIKTGLNLSSITGKTNEQKGFFPGGHFGILVEIPISSKISFQPELMYSAQGYNSKNKGLVPTAYINMPLMGKYYLSEKFSLEAGPQIGFLPEKTNDTFNAIDFGFNFGISYKFNNNFNCGLRYNVGLNNTNTVENNKNRVLQFSIGYFFSKKKKRQLFDFN